MPERTAAFDRAPPAASRGRRSSGGRIDPSAQIGRLRAALKVRVRAGRAPGSPALAGATWQRCTKFRSAREGGPFLGSAPGKLYPSLPRLSLGRSLSRAAPLRGSCPSRYSRSAGRAGPDTTSRRSGPRVNQSSPQRRRPRTESSARPASCAPISTPTSIRRTAAGVSPRDRAHPAAEQYSRVPAHESSSRLSYIGARVRGAAPAPLTVHRGGAQISAAAGTLHFYSRRARAGPALRKPP